MKIEKLNDEYLNIQKESFFDKYEKRPETLKNVTFVAKHEMNNNGAYVLRKFVTLESPLSLSVIPGDNWVTMTFKMGKKSHG